MSSPELSGRTALVTEVASDLGRVTARLLKQAGAQLILSGRDADAGRAAVDALGPGARFIAADLTDLESVDHLARQVPVDILVNNAEVVDVDTLAGLYFLVAAVAPCMARYGGGAIVNVAASATGAVAALTRSWATEFGSVGVRVNTVVAASRANPWVAWANLSKSPKPSPSSPPVGRASSPAPHCTSTAERASYEDDERWITRRGATDARRRQLTRAGRTG